MAAKLNKQYLGFSYSLRKCCALNVVVFLLCKSHVKMSVERDSRPGRLNKHFRNVLFQLERYVLHAHPPFTKNRFTISGEVQVNVIAVTTEIKCLAYPFFPPSLHPNNNPRLEKTLRLYSWRRLEDGKISKDASGANYMTSGFGLTYRKPRAKQPYQQNSKKIQLE